MPRSMTESEVDAFLDSKPGWITLSTISPSGFPHTVPIGFFRVGETIYCGCRHPTQKTRNIERNPNVSLMLEGGRSMSDIKGVLIQGRATLVFDAGERLELSRTLARGRGVPDEMLPKEVSPTGVFVKVERVKTISWDYSG